MRPYILSETNWKLIKKFKYDLSILPWGATEAHNYHLPYATDNIQVESIIEEAGKIAWNKIKKFIILPTIPFGVNTGQKDILLNINMNPSTQHKILSDIIRVLNRQGINKLLVLKPNQNKSFSQNNNILFIDLLLFLDHYFIQIMFVSYNEGINYNPSSLF